MNDDYTARSILHAIDLAAEWYSPQELAHAARVAARCSYIGARWGVWYSDPEEEILAWLHDLVEGGYPLAKLRESGWFSERVLLGLDAITRREGEQYEPDYLARVKANPLAAIVKLADLADNTERVDTLSDSLKGRYERAKAFLTQA